MRPEFCDGQWIREPTDEETEVLLGLPVKLAQIRLRQDASANTAAGKEAAAEEASPETRAEPLPKASAAEPPSETSVPVSGKRRLTRRRASDTPLLGVPWEDYERVLRAVLQLKCGGPQAGRSAEGNIQLDAELETTLVRWGLNPQAWLAAFEQLDRCCSRALGAAHRMAQRAGELGQRWIQGVGWCREVFAGPPFRCVHVTT